MIWRVGCCVRTWFATSSYGCHCHHLTLYFYRQFVRPTPFNYFHNVPWFPLFTNIAWNVIIFCFVRRDFFISHNFLSCNCPGFIFIKSRIPYTIRDRKLKLLCYNKVSPNIVLSTIRIILILSNLYSAIKKLFIYSIFSETEIPDPVPDRKYNLVQ